MGALNRTNIMFKGKWEARPSKIEAYRRLLQRFLADRPDIPNDPYKWPRIARRRTKICIGKTVDEVHEKTPHLDHRVRKVNIEWDINTVMGEETILNVLSEFAKAAGYRLGEDWDWDSGSGRLSTKAAEMMAMAIDL